MSNTNYASNTTFAANQPGFTATTHTTTSGADRYGASSSHSPQVQPQQVHKSQLSYGQSQARPRSVNTDSTQAVNGRGLPPPAMAAGYPSQRPQAQPLYAQQQQRSASPATHQYSTAPVNSARAAKTTAAAPQQYNDYSDRQLPSAEASRASQHASSTESYHYGAMQTSAPPSAPIAPPAPSASASNTYAAQNTTTVDPMAVYDPWPEYQRKQDVIRAQKAAEDAARAEEDRIAEEARITAEQKKGDERKRQEELERSRQPKPAPKPRAKKTQKQQSTIPDAAPTATYAQTSEEPEGALAAEIRAMMAKMRELNGKDPALLARIWEEERKAKAPKSPIVQTNSVPQSSAQPAIQDSSPAVATSRTDVIDRRPAAVSVVKPATPIHPQAVHTRAQPHATVNRSGGSTFWPTEKRVHLSKAAASFLIATNPTFSLSSEHVLSLLDGNPSYIQLCEQLEQMGLKLDRAAFAKNLLAVVPDINPAGRKASAQPTPVPVQRAMVPPAVMKREIATPAAATSQYTPASASPANGSYRPSPGNATPAATPAPVAKMISIKAEMRPPANKEEAARKRNMSDLIDMTLLSDEEDMGPPPKRLNSTSVYAFDSTTLRTDDATQVDAEPAIANFPIASVPSRSIHEAVSYPVQPFVGESRDRIYAQNLDRSNALRRNSYNPATIARDVLLACGRHPSERQLNQHLDCLRTNIPKISFDSDLSTIKWDLIDPGAPPPGYFKNSVQTLTEDADDEDNSDDDDDDNQRPRSTISSHTISGESGAPGKVQALPEAINPFKPKRRGRPPRHSYPDGVGPATPKRPANSTAMSGIAPRSASPASGVGYQAFRSVTEYGPDGQPLPKKKGRPVGWRKAIHGSAAAQARSSGLGHTNAFKLHQPSQPSSLRNVRTGAGEPIRIDSRSPSVSNRIPKRQSYKCNWKNCVAELHNLETLRKHVFKLHSKVTTGDTLECLWGDCGREGIRHDPTMNITTERQMPHSFDLESDWRGHIQHKHFDPLSWELGDGPASGLSGKED